MRVKCMSYLLHGSARAFRSSARRGGVSGARVRPARRWSPYCRGIPLILESERAGRSGGEARPSVVATSRRFHPQSAADSLCAEPDFFFWWENPSGLPSLPRIYMLLRSIKALVLSLLHNAPPPPRPPSHRGARRPARRRAPPARPGAAAAAAVVLEFAGRCRRATSSGTTRNFVYVPHR